MRYGLCLACVMLGAHLAMQWNPGSLLDAASPLFMIQAVLQLVIAVLPMPLLGTLIGPGAATLGSAIC